MIRQRCKESRLSKCQSDLKLNGTQEMDPFSGTVCHGLSHGVIRFFLRELASKSTRTEPSDWLLNIFEQSEGGF